MPLLGPLTLTLALGALLGPNPESPPASPHRLVSLEAPTLFASHDPKASLGVRFDPETDRVVIAAGGRLVLPPATLPPFDEYLPSWNVDVPEEGGFIVEGRFATAQGEFGPWVPFGGWGVVPEGSSTTIEWTTGDGDDAFTPKVEIDVLESPRPLRRAQLRIVAAARHPIAVARLDAVSTSNAANRGLDRRDPPPAEDLVLAVPARSQRVVPEIASRICSPTSVAMLLAYHGADHPTEEVAALLFDRAHGIYGNWNRAVQGAYLLGVPGRLERLATWREVRTHLGAGRPFAISIRAAEGELTGAPYERSSGHLLVVCGLLADGRVAVRDPASSDLDRVGRLYSRENLETVWLERNGVAYVLLGKEGEDRPRR